MKLSLCKSLTLAAALVVPFGFAQAEQLALVETNEMTFGETTTIVWESSWEDLNYTLGETIPLSVMWEVVAGSAEFQEFMARKKTFTPKGVTGNFMATTSTDNSAEGVLVFTDLKSAGKDKKKGTAHLTLWMTVDSTGDDEPDLDVGLGVNVHVCDNGDPTTPCE